MGFGPRRVELSPEATPDPDRIFTDQFEGSDALGKDDVEYFNSLGQTDDQRLQRYVDEQLSLTLPETEWEQRRAEHGDHFNTLDESLARTFSERSCQGGSVYEVPYKQVEAAAFCRAVYGRNQLFELIVDFWHNHFNIYVEGNRDIESSWADWDRSVLRRYAFGNFHDMLQASAKHPAMLRYLDNYANSSEGFNENYARELFELHTLGAINYAGTVQPFDAPVLAENPYVALNDPLLNANGYGNASRTIQAQYTDNDVYEAAKALTGWRYDDEDFDNPDGSCNGGSASFYVAESQHDSNGGKTVLTAGLQLIAADQGALEDGETVIKLAAYHPGTARYIALKLCQRLIADAPPESIVQAAADTFYANRKSNRQIERTLRTILLSNEFKDPASWGKKIKRPFEYVVSAMRAAGCDHTWRHEDETRDTSDTSRFLNSYFRGAGQRLFFWRTPDGYPDDKAAWMGSTTLVQNWRTVDWLLDENDDDDTNRLMRVFDITLDNFSGDPTPRELVAFWCNWILGFTPPGGWVSDSPVPYSNEPTELGKACMQFITQQGFSGNNDGAVWPADEPIPREWIAQDSWPDRWHRRVRGVVKLILWSPNFMQR
jgi:uncharacterized protein (DUF1800 family)